MTLNNEANPNIDFGKVNLVSEHPENDFNLLLASQKKTIGSFDLNSLRLSQSFDELYSAKKLITRVPVRKPNKSEFFRVHPGQDWRIQVMALELKEENETYVLLPAISSAIPELIKPITLHTLIDRHNNVFMTPVPLPNSEGRRNPWHQSLAEVVEMAEIQWVRISANRHVGAYDALVATGKLAEPEWPENSFNELFEIAFRGRIIDNLQHPVIRQLLGEA